MQDPFDVDTIRSYGRDEATFGGLYFDGDVLVALFTADLAVHRSRLEPMLHSPGQVRLATADRSYVEVKAAHGRVKDALLGPGRPYPEVFSAGIGVAQDQFVIVVLVEELNDELEEAIRTAVEPDAIVLRRGGRPRPTWRS